MPRRAAGREASAGDAAGMGNLCHQQPPAAPRQRGRRRAGHGAALPGSPLLLLLLLASSVSASKGEERPPRNPFLHCQLCDFWCCLVVVFFWGGGCGCRPGSLPASRGGGGKAGLAAALGRGRRRGWGQGGRDALEVAAAGHGFGAPFWGGLLRVSRQDYPVLAKLRSSNLGKWLLLKAISF